MCNIHIRYTYKTCAHTTDCICKHKIALNLAIFREDVIEIFIQMELNEYL